MSLQNKIMSGYKQSLLFWLSSIAYSFIAYIVITIGILIVFIGDMIAIGAIISIIGIFLIYIGFIAAFMFAYSRGSDRQPISFMEGYKSAIKLIMELIVVILIALGIVILGIICLYYVSFGLGIFILVIAIINYLLLTGVLIFYTWDYITNNIK